MQELIYLKDMEAMRYKKVTIYRFSLKRIILVLMILKEVHMPGEYPNYCMNKKNHRLKIFLNRLMMIHCLLQQTFSQFQMY